MRLGIPLSVLIALYSAHAAAVSLSVAGFTFPDGERSFADSAALISGSIRLCGATASVSSALAGSDVLDCINSADSSGAIVDVSFIDNLVINAPGPDLVIFELSGPLGAGTPDSREVFGVSVFDGEVFTPFQTVTPIDTGYRTTGGVNPDGVFAVQLDLADFGIPSDTRINLVRLHIYNVNLGTKSGDITALGALNSGVPVPEPGTASLLALGLLIVVAAKQSSRTIAWKDRNESSLGNETVSSA